MLPVCFLFSVRAYRLPPNDWPLFPAKALVHPLHIDFYWCIVYVSEMLLFYSSSLLADGLMYMLTSSSFWHNSGLAGLSVSLWAWWVLLNFSLCDWNIKQPSRSSFINECPDLTLRNSASSLCLCWLPFSSKPTEDWDRDLKVTYKSQIIYIGSSLLSANTFSISFGKTSQSIVTCWKYHYTLSLFLCLFLFFFCTHCSHITSEQRTEWKVSCWCSAPYRCVVHFSHFFLPWVFHKGLAFFLPGASLQHIGRKHCIVGFHYWVNLGCNWEDAFVLTSICSVNIELLELVLWASLWHKYPELSSLTLRGNNKANCANPAL